MHIIVANNIYPPIMAGGAELIVSYLCEGLANRGHRVTVISTCGPEMEPYPVEMRNGVEVIRYFPRNRYWTFARAALKGQELGFRDKINTARWHLKDAWNRDAGRHARAIFMSSRPDVLHTHVIDGFSATIWYEAKRIGIPVIHTAHDYHLICPRAFLLSRSWQIWPVVFIVFGICIHLRTSTCLLVRRNFFWDFTPRPGYKAPRAQSCLLAFHYQPRKSRFVACRSTVSFFSPA